MVWLGFARTVPVSGDRGGVYRHRYRCRYRSLINKWHTCRGLLHGLLQPRVVYNPANRFEMAEADTRDRDVSAAGALRAQGINRYGKARPPYGVHMLPWGSPIYLALSYSRNNGRHVCYRKFVCKLGPV